MGVRVHKESGLDEGKAKAEQYRQRAADIRFKARSAVDETTRADLLRLAESWERLANRMSGAHLGRGQLPEAAQRPKP